MFAGTANKKILVINSYHRGYLWSDRIMEGLEDSLSKLKNTEVYYEFLDTKRIYSREYMENLTNIFRLKYQKSRFDAIVVSDDNGFNFVLGIHDTVFKKAPVVFCGINDYHPSMIKGYANISGVSETYDAFETLKAARHIFPEKNLYISVADKTKSGLIDQKLFLSAMRKMDNRIRYEVWDSLSVEELEDKIQKIPDNALMIFTGFIRDKQGVVVPQERTKKILSKSNVPVFGRQEWLMNDGLFGGMIVSGFFQGKTVAEMVKRVLEGEDINKIPVEMKSANRYIFDHNIMEKFDVSPGDLPGGSIIINKPKGFFEFYQDYKAFILISTLVFLLIIIIIMAVSIVKINNLNNERKKLIDELSDSLARIKRLDGLLPICASCKKIRNDQGYWEQLEHYLVEHSDADFSHTLCDECAVKLYPDLYKDKEKK